MDNIFDQFFETADTNPDFVAAGYCADIAKNVENIMEEKGISKKQLAEKLNCTKSNVTKILSGEANLTLLSLAKLSIALDAKFSCSFKLHAHSDDGKFKVLISQGSPDKYNQFLKSWISEGGRIEHLMPKTRCSVPRRVVRADKISFTATAISVGKPSSSFKARLKPAAISH